MGKENAVTAHELKKMWERSPERQFNVMCSKMLEAIKETKGKISISWSGGKDSSFMLYVFCMLWEQLGRQDEPIKVTFADTTNEHKYTRRYVKKEFIPFIENKFGVKIDLIISRPADNQTFATVALNKGLPLISKKVSMAIRRIRKYLKAAGLTYSDVEPYLEQTYSNRDKLREMGLNDDAILILLGYSCKHDNFKSSFKLAKRWRPLIPAEDIEMTEECCKILKKDPIHKVNKGIGDYQPMIGEMACDSKTRMDAYLKTGCNSFNDGKGKSKPMGAMTEQVLLHHINRLEIPINTFYGELVVKVNDDNTVEYEFTDAQRSGCCLCGFGIEHEPDRFVKLMKTEPAKVRFAFKPKKDGGLGYKEACEFLNEHCGCKIQIPQID